MDFLTTTFNNALNAIRADMEEIINETDDAVDNNDSETHENVKKKKKAQKKEFEDTFLHMEKLIISQLPPVTNKGAMKISKRTSPTNAPPSILIPDPGYPISPIQRISNEMVLAQAAPGAQQRWTPELVKKLAVVAGALEMDYIVYDPITIFHRELCKFGLTKTNAGCRMFCPNCKQNKYVNQTKKGFSADSGHHARKILSPTGVCLGITRRYICSNIECSEVKKWLDTKIKKNDRFVTRRDFFITRGSRYRNPLGLQACLIKEETGYSFSSDDSRIWTSLPFVIQESFGIIILNGRFDITVTLAKDWMIHPEDTVSSKYNHLLELESNKIDIGMSYYNQFIQQCSLQYEEPTITSYFSSSSSSAPRGGGVEFKQFPKHLCKLRQGLVCSKAKIRTIFMSSYKKVKKFLDYKMSKLAPTKICKFDYTFKVANRMDFFFNGQSTKLAGALGLFLDERGLALKWTFATQENKKEILKMSFDIQKRAAEKKVTFPHYIYNDTCCMGLSVPRNHYLFGVFPNLKRILKDIFHGIDGIVTEGPGHERHLDFIKSMSSAMLKINNDSRQNVINKVKVVDCCTHSRAARMVDTSRKFRPYLHFETGTAEDLLKRYDHVVNVELQLAKAIWKENEQISNGFKNGKKRNAYFKRSYRDGSISGIGSTMHSLNLFRKHLEKGCVTDPLPTAEMYVECNCGLNGKCNGHKYGKKFRTKRSSSQVENTNRLLNLTVQNVSHQAADYADAKCMLMLSKNNFRILNETFETSWFFQLLPQRDENNKKRKDEERKVNFEKNEKFGLEFFLTSLHEDAIKGVLDQCEKNGCSPQEVISVLDSDDDSDDSNNSDDEMIVNDSNSSSSSSSSNNRSSNAVKKYSKKVGLGQIGDDDADLALQCIANAYSSNEKDPMKAAASAFNMEKLQSGKMTVINETLLQKFAQEHASMKCKQPVMAEKKNIVEKKEISSKEILRKKRQKELKRKRKAVKNIRIDSGKKQALCTVLKKTDQYEWNDINTLHHDRLKTLLRVVGFTFSNHISVTVEELVRNVESNWEKIQEYYKKIDNAAEV